MSATGNARFDGSFVGGALAAFGVDLFWQSPWRAEIVVSGQPSGRVISGVVLEAAWRPFRFRRHFRVLGRPRRADAG